MRPGRTAFLFPAPGLIPTEGEPGRVREQAVEEEGPAPAARRADRPAPARRRRIAERERAGGLHDRTVLRTARHLDLDVPQDEGPRHRAGDNARRRPPDDLGRGRRALARCEREVRGGITDLPRGWARRGAAEQGRVGRGRAGLGAAWPGWARRGRVRRGEGRTGRRVSVRGAVRRALARRGRAGRGRARRGKARTGDEFRFGRGWARLGEAWPGEARLGMAGRGWARRGEARNGVTLRRRSETNEEGEGRCWSRPRSRRTSSRGRSSWSG